MTNLIKIINNNVLSLYKRQFKKLFMSTITIKTNSNDIKKKDNKIIKKPKNNETIIKIDDNFDLKANYKLVNDEIFHQFSLELFTNAMIEYHKIFGDSWVNRNYIIPFDDERWPKVYHGYNLGVAAAQIRDLFRFTSFLKYYKSTKEYLLLQSIKFGESKYKENALAFIKCLEVFVSLYPDEVVKTYYQIPKEATITIGNNTIPNPYPFCRWGESLGRKLRYNISSRTKLTNYIITNYPTTYDHRKIIVKALILYYKVNSNVYIKESYIIPSDDNSYPMNLRGYRLGYYISLYIKQNKSYTDFSKKSKISKIIDIINKTNYENTEYLPLNKLFLIQNPIKKEEKVNRIIKGIKIYNSIHPNKKIPYLYVVQNDDERYPKYLRGANLGQMVRGIKKFGFFQKYKDIFVNNGIDIDRL